MFRSEDVRFLTILGRKNESYYHQRACSGRKICAMSGDQRFEEQIWPHMKRNRQRFDVHILGKSCVSLLVKCIRETYGKKQWNDSDISAGLLMGKETHQSGAGPMNNSGMIALKIGQYNKTCR